MALKLSLIIKAVDQASGSFKRINSAAKSLAGAGMRQLTREGGSASRAVDRVRGAISRIPASMARAGAATRRLAGRAGLGALLLSARAVGSTIRRVFDVAKWGVLGAAGGAAYGVGSFIGGIIPLASKFEQFQVILENTEGSVAKARKAMDWVKTFAKTTPYEVSEVMEAFVQLKAYGIDPTNGSLESLGNAAAGMGKGLMQAVEMIADAQTGEFERIKEFGVKAKVAGEKVTFTYMKEGKERTRIAKNSAAEIQKALLGIFDERFKGMMDRQSRTLSGLWSNIKDQFANFQLDIADAGFFDAVKGKVQQILDRFSALAKDGTLKRWATEISAKLTEITDKATKFITETNWSAVAQGMGTIVSTLVSIVSWINSARIAWERFELVKERDANANRLNGWMSRWVDSPNERRQLMNRNLELNDRIHRLELEANGTTPEAEAANARNRQRAAAAQSRQRQKSAFPAGSPMRPGVARPTLAWPTKVPPSQSKVSLLIKTEPGTTATVTGMKAGPGTKLDVSRGRLGMVG
jgi:phage tail tape-measure protein